MMRDLVGGLRKRATKIMCKLHLGGVPVLGGNGDGGRAIDFNPGAQQGCICHLHFRHGGVHQAVVM